MIHEHAGTYRTPIAEMRRLVRSQFDIPDELETLRARLAAERRETHAAMTKLLVDRLGGELRSILENHARKREDTRREVAATVARLDAAASDRAGKDAHRFHVIRSDYLKTFGDHLAALEGVTQMKFRTPLEWTSNDREGDCTHHGYDFPTSLWTPWLGPESTVSSDIAPSTSPAGIWLYPRLHIDSHSCDDMRPATTYQDVAYSLPPLDQSFGITAVRVDLIANGFGSSIFGDTGWFANADPLYEHSFVQLDVYLSQLVDGAWQEWPLVSDRLFSGKGEYSRELRALLSAQTYPANLFLRNTSAGGGEILCYVAVTSSIQSIGEGAHVTLDFGGADGRGIFIGGVALLGGAL